MPDLETLEQKIADLEVVTAKLRNSQRSRAKKLAALKATIAEQQFTPFELLEVERFEKLVAVRAAIEKHGFTAYEIGVLSTKGPLEKHLASLPSLD